MTRRRDKYFETARRMDEAFLKLLSRKDFSFITVKEICAAAGVNRSTFYLHYETVGDLLTETVDYMVDNFLSQMTSADRGFVDRIQDLPAHDLYLITPEYLTPYLEYIHDNKCLFRTAVAHAGVLRLEKVYDRLFRHVFEPILVRCGVPEEDRPYVMDFYILGLMAVITRWLEGDCKDPIERIETVMQECVPPLPRAATGAANS